MRIVLDTDVVVAGIRSRDGASQRLLRLALMEQYRLLISVPLIVEYEAVMTRSEHLIASRLSVKDVESLLDAVVSVAEPVRLAFLWRPQLKDPADDMVLETAVNGGADILATFNQKDFGSHPMKFGIRIARPGDVLAALEKQR